MLSFVLGTLLGIFAAWRRGGWLDRTLPAFTLLQATPYFFLALVMIYVFALELNWLPFGQGYSLGLTPGWNWPFISSAITHSILPALTIIATSVGGWMLQMRNVMLTTISEDYILVAQAKGLSARRVMFTYGARNAILPNIAGFALALGFVVAGALVMEIVFSYPGVGLTLYNAVTSNDYPLMQGIFLVISVTVLTASLLADIAYAIADPRARTRGARSDASIDVRVAREYLRAVLAALVAVFRRLPLKAKFGVLILAFFMLIAIIGPGLRRMTRTRPRPRRCRRRRTSTICSEPARPVATCSPRCWSGRARR